MHNCTQSLTCNSASQIYTIVHEEEFDDLSRLTDTRHGLINRLFAASRNLHINAWPSFWVGILVH
uniref:Uncharacterized protein n=2 Tax=Agrobacterium TaxID=357 RepID=A0A2Z2PMD1_9HYPH|nr:hypothetical protein [Agrobacterium fabrum]ASK49584.1 hypothetical protein [Agrobacterium larrymoorei]